MKKAVLLVLMTCPAWGAFSGFNARQTLTIDHTKVDSSQASYANFPVLVSTNGVAFSTSAAGGQLLNANGYDLIYTSDSSCGQQYALNFDTETVNNTGSAPRNEFVKIPLVSSTTDTLFYRCLGNALITSYQGVSTNTYDSDFHLIWHLPNGSVLTARDSTIGSDSGTLVNAPTATAGEIDGAAAFVAASNQHIDENTSALTSVSSVTFSAWVNATSFPNAYNTVGGKISPTTSVGYVMYVKSNGKLAMYVVGALSSANYDGTGTATLLAGTTYYLSLTYDNTTGLKGYVNGVLDGTGAAFGPMTLSIGPFQLSNDPNNPGRNWNGWIDESRVSDVVRPIGWEKTSFTNQSAPSTFVTQGAIVTSTATTVSAPFIGAEF